MKRYLTHTDAPEQARVPPEAVIVVVTVVQPVPKGPWVPEAVLDRRGPSAPEVFPAPRAPLLRQYMHNTEIAVTMRLSTILKTIKQPL